jgi:mRNA interferase MazF
MNKIKPCRGDIWFIDLDPTVGHEQANKRPCLIVSTNQFNHGPKRMVGMLPITTKSKLMSWLVKIEPPEGGVKQTSFIICDQLRMTSCERLIGTSLGSVSEATLRAVEDKIRILFEL